MIKYDREIDKMFYIIVIVTENIIHNPNLIYTKRKE